MPKRKTNNQKINNGANLGFGAQLWCAADVLLSNVNTVEYKHGVLSLFFYQAHFLMYLKRNMFNSRKKLIKEFILKILMSIVQSTFSGFQRKLDSLILKLMLTTLGKEIGILNKKFMKICWFLQEKQDKVAKFEKIILEKFEGVGVWIKDTPY